MLLVNGYSADQMASALLVACKPTRERDQVFDAYARTSAELLKRQAARIAELERLTAALADRCERQSALLGRRAERDAWAAPTLDALYLELGGEGG